MGTQMNVRFWGTRGSIPAPGPSTLRHGGNTSCVEVRLADNTLIILDSGSGIRQMGAALGPCVAELFLSHYHWDHIQGMPFFGPAYSPGSAIRIHGPAFEGVGPEHILTGQMHAPYFPAPASEWCGIRGYETVSAGQQFGIGAATIRTAQLSHPGMTLGYRIEEAGHVLVYMSDNEPDLASPELLSGMVDLARDADLLLHDCQYTEGEYALKRGFGHSTPRQAVRVATEAGVRQLVLFHHDPGHGDEQVEILAEEAAALAPDIQVDIAREGETLPVARQSFAMLHGPQV